VLFCVVWKLTEKLLTFGPLSSIVICMLPSVSSCSVSDLRVLATSILNLRESKEVSSKQTKLASAAICEFILRAYHDYRVVVALSGYRTGLRGGLQCFDSVNKAISMDVLTVT
jgi:3-deoxy-D-manno-octulosonic acid (KDO) 8-phosphate synthase